MTYDNDELNDIMPSDDLDQLLRDWHDQNADTAASMREQLMARLGEDRSPVAGRIAPEEQAPATGHRLLASPALQLAAAVAILVTLVGLILSVNRHAGTAPMSGGALVQTHWVSEGGRLDALDAQRRPLGTCPLEHTDVDVEITGTLARVTVTQRYANPFSDHIEAVYTFPLSNDAAVDRMTMTIGDRVIEGEVHERTQARRIYEAARSQGQVTALLEQERPNIFTQSVANIPPREPVEITISYIEPITQTDGEFTFHYPMTIGPRYIPGQVIAPQDDVHGLDHLGLPRDVRVRNGRIFLHASPRITEVQLHGAARLNTASLRRLLDASIPIEALDFTDDPDRSVEFTVIYDTPDDGPVTEKGVLFRNGVGVLGGRWFCQAVDLPRRANVQVPDAWRILPPYSRPANRPGHDIDLSVSLDTGGPGILAAESELHDVVRNRRVIREDGLASRLDLALSRRDELPNRDFILTWKQTTETIENAVFTHAGDLGQFVTFMLMPPERVEDAESIRRDLVFVLDCSGSMSGLPVEKAKAVLSEALSRMRPDDRFNIIAFNNSTFELWDTPRQATPAAIAEAQSFVDSKQGGGGTEMMSAVHRALHQHSIAGPDGLSLDALLNLPADGREVTLRVPAELVEHENNQAQWNFPCADGLVVRCVFDTGRSPDAPGERDLIEWQLKGSWTLVNGHRTLRVSEARARTEHDNPPMQLVVFLTDGQVGNDMSILGTIDKACRDSAVRFFSFGIGDSTNRYLLDGMARSGRGVAEYVTNQSDADEAVDRFVRRIQTPVLRNVALELPEGVEVSDLIVRGTMSAPPRDENNPSTLHLPDLYDVSPVIVHAKYTGSGKGTVALSGYNALGDWGRTIEADFPGPGAAPEQSTVATMWARAMVERLMNEHLDAAQHGTLPDQVRAEIVAIGETYHLLTQYTSFVAVEQARVNFNGEPRLVRVPLATPSGQVFQGMRHLLSRAPSVPRGNESLGLETLGRKAEINEHLKGMRESQSQGNYRGVQAHAEQILKLDDTNEPALRARELLARATVAGQAGTDIVVGDRFYYADTDGDLTRDSRRSGLEGVNGDAAVEFDDLRFGLAPAEERMRVTGAAQVTWNLPLDATGLGETDFYDELIVDLERGFRSPVTYTISADEAESVTVAALPFTDTVTTGETITGVSLGDIRLLGNLDVTTRKDDSELVLPDAIRLLARQSQAEPASQPVIDARRDAIRRQQEAAAPMRRIARVESDGDDGSLPAPSSRAAESGPTGFSAPGTFGGGSAFYEDAVPGRTAGEIVDERAERLTEVWQAAASTVPVGETIVVGFSPAPIEVKEEDDLGEARVISDREALRVEPTEDITTLEGPWKKLANLRAGRIVLSAQPDIDRLFETSMTLDVTNARLDDVLRRIADKAGLTLQIEETRLKETGVSASQAITLQLPEASIGRVLDSVCRSLHADWQQVDWTVTDGVLLVSSDSAIGKRTSVVIYDCRDLVQDDELGVDFSSDVLADVIRDLIDFNGWRDNGGETGSLTTLDGNLVITNTDRNHRDIRQLLAALRQGDGARIVDISDHLTTERQEIVVYSIDDLVDTLISARGCPCAFGELADTTREAVVDCIIGHVQTSVAAESWRDVGGSTGRMLAFSEHLIVLQTPINQQAVSAVLDEMRAAPARRSELESQLRESIETALAARETNSYAADDPAYAEAVVRATVGDSGTFELRDGSIKVTAGAEEHVVLLDLLNELRQARADLETAKSARPIGAPSQVSMAIDHFLLTLSATSDETEREELLHQLEDVVAETGNALAAATQSLFGDETLDDDKRRQYLDALLEPARLREQAMRIVITMAQRINADLLQAMTTSQVEEPIGIAVLLSNSEADTVRSVKELGFDIEDVSESTRTAVGHATPEAIARLGQSEHVSRIEPLE